MASYVQFFCNRLDNLVLMVYYMAENLNWLGSVGHSFFGKYTNGEQLVKLICYGWFGSIALNIVKHLLMVPPPPSLPPNCFHGCTLCGIVNLTLLYLKLAEGTWQRKNRGWTKGGHSENEGI